MFDRFLVMTVLCGVRALPSKSVVTLRDRSYLLLRFVSRILGTCDHILPFCVMSASNKVPLEISRVL